MCASAASKKHRAEVDEDDERDVVQPSTQRLKIGVEQKWSGSGASGASGSGSALGTVIDNARSAVDLRVCNFATVTCLHALHPICERSRNGQCSISESTQR